MNEMVYTMFSLVPLKIQKIHNKYIHIYTIVRHVFLTMCALKLSLRENGLPQSLHPFFCSCFSLCLNNNIKINGRGNTMTEI